LKWKLYTEWDAHPDFRVWSDVRKECGWETIQTFIQILEYLTEKGEYVNDDDDFCYYLSLAAGVNLAPTFEEHGKIISGETEDKIKSSLIVKSDGQVDLIITDPEGLQLSKSQNDIEGAIYYDGVDDFIVIPERKIGSYQIDVMWEPDAEVGGTYNLKAAAGDTIVDLAEDAPVSNLPLCYIIEFLEEKTFVPNEFISMSPVDLEIIDPEGLIINKETNQIPGAVYLEYDVNADGNTDDVITIPYRKIGNYQITVFPEPESGSSDTYTLEVSLGDTTIVLAENVLISDIPDQPYMIRSTEEGIIQVIPATIDFDPDTLNLQSKGKWVTTYIELQEGYDLTDIDVGTVILNDQVQAETDPTEIGDYDDDGIADLMVKFDRSNVQEILEVGEEVEIIVAGELTDGTPFEGTDTVRVIEKGKGK
jgi:hypothetical protein